MAQEAVHHGQCNTKFKVNEAEIEMVQEFKYLGRHMTNKNDDWLAVANNIKRAKCRWARIKTILKLDTSSVRTMSSFYKAVVQSVMLYGAETWTISVTMKKILETFNNQVARNLTRTYIRPNVNDTSEWIYPDTEEVLSMENLKTLEEYTRNRRMHLRDTVEE